MSLIVAVDARQIQASGIGRYLRSVLDALRETKAIITLLGHPKDRQLLLKYAPRRTLPLSLSVYNPLGQLVLPLVVPPCDVYFTPHFSTTGLPVRARRRVIVVHDVFHLSESAKLSILVRAYAREMYRSALRTADAVIAVSQFTRSEIEKHFPRYSKKIIVIPNCIDQNIFSPDPKKPRISGPYLLFVGNLKPHKNLLTSIRARKLCRQHDLKLVIAGALTGFITGMEKQLDQYRADPMCVFVGTPDDGELRRLYSHADCLLFPSFYEGFGFPALEAMACGTPVVCSDIPALRETCADAAMYCDPRSPESFADTIGRVRSDTALREKLRLAGAQRVALHSLDRFRNSTLQALFGG